MAISSLATSQSPGCRACRGLHGRPHTGSAARSPPCASAAPGHAGRHQPPPASAAPGQAPDGTGTPAAPATRPATPRCHPPPAGTWAAQSRRTVTQPSPPAVPGTATEHPPMGDRRHEPFPSHAHPEGGDGRGCYHSSTTPCDPRLPSRLRHARSPAGERPSTVRPDGHPGARRLAGRLGVLTGPCAAGIRSCHRSLDLVRCVVQGG
jgi:hypothetical protein